MATSRRQPRLPSCPRVLADTRVARYFLSPLGPRTGSGAVSMIGLQHTWAVVLAAGDGKRLSALTADSEGTPVPKQFCSLNGGESLLQEALQRAKRIVPLERVCAMVAGQHRPYWRPE